MNELTFEPFQKITRLKRDCTITEKIDGTNSQIVFDTDGNVLVGSRKREIWPEGTEGKPKGCDNVAFARWVYENKEALFDFLGEGRHYGEWCGGKIQRGYGVHEKHFLLFNTSRFGEGSQEIPETLKSVGLGSVPVLYNGPFTTTAVDEAMIELKDHGSYFADGFVNPEGVVVYHHALRSYFKITFEHDDKGKWDNKQQQNKETLK